MTLFWLTYRHGKRRRNWPDAEGAEKPDDFRYWAVLRTRFSHLEFFRL
jgi:hypothetical protein